MNIDTWCLWAELEGLSGQQWRHLAHFIHLGSIPGSWEHLVFRLLVYKGGSSHCVLALAFCVRPSRDAFAIHPRRRGGEG